MYTNKTHRPTVTNTLQPHLNRLNLLVLEVMSHGSARPKTHLLTVWIAVVISAHSTEGHSLAVDR